MTKKLLHNKNYMLLVIGNFMSLLGSNIQQFVLALYVLKITGSATIFASMVAISILPRLVLSPIAGVFGDWFDRKKAMIALDSINAVVLSGFALYLFYFNSLSIGLVYILVISLEVTEIFFHSSMAGVLPSVVEKDSYLEANSLKSMLVSFGQLMAPIIGALIFGIFGLMVAIIINAVSFLLSAISESFMHLPPIAKRSEKFTFSQFKQELASGIQVIKDSPTIRTIIAVAVVINFSIAPFFSVGIIFLVKEVLNQSDLQFSLVQVVLSASMILAPVILAKRLKQMRLGNVLIYAFLGVGILVMLISLSINSYIYAVGTGMLSFIYILVICFFIGIIVTAVNISVSTILQQTVPVEYMGRTSTVLSLSVTIAIPIGQMLFGYLYDIINPGLVVLLNGFIILLAVMVFYQRIKQIDDATKEDVSAKIKESRVMVNEV